MALFDTDAAAPLMTAIRQAFDMPDNTLKPSNNGDGLGTSRFRSSSSFKVSVRSLDIL
jgi:hypothetical protein